MAWTAPRDWTTGELVTASIMNTHVRDNLVDLRTDVDYLEGKPYAIATVAGTTSAGAWTPGSLSSVAADGLTVAAAQLTVVRAGVYSITFHGTSGSSAVSRGARIVAGGTTVGQDGVNGTGQTYQASGMASLAAAAAITADVFSASAGETISGRLAAAWLRAV